LTQYAERAGTSGCTSVSARSPTCIPSHSRMAVTLYGNDSVTLTVEVPRALRGTLVLFIEASALRNPQGARVYVEVYLEGADGREHELGNFTFFGLTGDADKQAFVFALDTVEREALATDVVQVRASMKPFDEKNGDISDVRVDLQAWLEVR
jgi:hypothetical protein